MLLLWHSDNGSNDAHARARTPHTYTQIHTRILAGGIYNFSVIFHFSDNFAVRHSCDLTIADEEDLKTLRSGNFKDDDQCAIGVWDGRERQLIQCPPLARASMTHRHQPFETAYVELLKSYNIPDALQRDIDNKDSFRDFDPWLKPETYRTRLHNLLWIEEAAEIKNMRRFDLPSVQFVAEMQYLFHGISELMPPDAKIFGFTVAGLAERRPSVLVGDRLFAWDAECETDYEYEGWVCKVTADTVYTRFNRSFEQVAIGRPFHVRFEYDRLQMRCKHRAVDHCPVDLLWPKPDAHRAALDHGLSLPGREPTIPADGQPVDTYQSAAICAIVRRRSLLESGHVSQAPFLLRGSFGCGKTHTLVECVRATLHNCKRARVLVCSESNSVADLLCIKLGKFCSTSELLRYNAMGRTTEYISPDDLKPYCLFAPDSDGKTFEVPTLEKLVNYSVVVSTASTAATMFGMGVKTAHFTHIFLDECAQMMEPTALIPMCMAGPSTVVVLCGDELQIGPMVRSESARHHGTCV
jgi:helicase MOV-10